MATRLTGFSKLVITVLILALLFFGGRYLLNNTDFGKNLKSQAEKEASVDNSSKDNQGSQTTSEPKGTLLKDNGDILKVQLVTWGGYGPGLYFNEGSEPTTRSRYWTDYNLKVKFVLNDDLIAALNGWIADEYQVLVQTADAFSLYTGPADIAAMKPKAFMQVDWSRGGDAIIVKRGINKINDLKGKRIAVAVPSPAQTLLITALEAANLKYADVQVSETSDNIRSAEIFQSPDVDAAVVWAPYDEVLKAVPGSKVLLTTKDQSHIIGDIMFAKDDYIKNNPEKIRAFYEGWMKATAEIQAEQSNRMKAAKLLGEFLNISADDAAAAMSLVHNTNHGDNLNFFGLNSAYLGQKGGDIYDKMNKEFVKMKTLEVAAPYWRAVINTSAIQAASANLSGPEQQSEKSKTFAPPTEADKTTEAVASKPISINFNTGEFTLSENAKTIIDLQFSDIAKTFANARIRVEGNTDNVGSKASNMTLSQKRAQSVAEYLQKTYGMDSNRFVIVGNGPDKPVPGCETNATSECKAKNRRTEFQLIPN